MKSLPSVKNAIQALESAGDVQDPFAGMSMLQKHKAMQGLPPSERRRMIESRRLAVLGASISKTSIGTYVSSLNTYDRHCVDNAENPSPVTQRNLEAFVSMKETKTTAQGAVSAIKAACRVLNMPSDFDAGRLRPLYKGLGNMREPGLNAKDPLYPWQVNVICNGKDDCEPADHQTQVLTQTTSTFLLRCKSEAIPLCRGKIGDSEGMRPSDLGKRHSAIFRSTQDKQDCCVIVLRCRKNKRGGQIIRRGCSCSSRPGGFCAVHHLLPYVETLEEEARLFPAWEYNNYLYWLTDRAAACGFEGNFGSHSLRKGMARAVARQDKKLLDILEAGSWSSACFKVYLDREELLHRDTLRSGLSSENEDSDRSDDGDIGDPVI